MMTEFRMPLFMLLVLLVAGLACGGGGNGGTEETETTNGPPAEVVRYVAEVSEKAELLYEALGEVWELSQEPKLGDEEWTLSLLVPIVVVQTTHQEFTEMDVPADMEDLHASLLQGTSDCDMSMSLLAKGIDEMDSAMLETGGALMESCLKKTNRAMEMITDYVMQFD